MSADNFTDKAQLAEDRGKCYEFLSSIYNLLPDSDFIAKIRNTNIYPHSLSTTLDVAASLDEREELKSGLTTIEAYWRQNSGMVEEELIQSLALDRTRLFRGPAREMCPESTSAVSCRRSAFGVLFSAEVYGE